jgi:ubiquitin-like 1-activating enzyme E1 A
MSISETEAKLYDRQIRLWGIDAQQRMSKTRLLVYGMKGISSETCKNLGFVDFFLNFLVLSGVGVVTIMDDENVTYPDLGAQFLVNEESVGKNVKKTKIFYFLREQKNV